MSDNGSDSKDGNKVEEPVFGYSVSLTPAEVRQRIHDYFATQKAVKRAWLFGSFARGDQDESSDVDILIEVPREQIFTLFDLAEIQHVLQNQLNRKVDLAMTGALREAFKKNIAKDLQIIYEG
ncbi:MAG: nucleotidyltransferase [Flavobacteriales bacterium]|nr:nucleotidyltransferase [Flavobacteriales bacterium]